ncbi:MAG TPA: universal stress protein [Solirubrobacteraceae bacterium]|nr:universal stress protein [Solirubrobacteraceae bacterium]
MFGKTIVCVDESSGGRDAIALAKQLVPPDGELTLAHVVCISAWEPMALRAAYATGERTKRGERERAEGLLRVARDQAGLASGRSSISTRVVWSPSVGRGLHEFAESGAADLLVLGSSRRGMLGRVSVGHHTRAALNGAPCAVAVAPAGYCDHFRTVRRIGVGYDGSLESKKALEIARELAATHHAELSACTAVSVPLPTIGPGPMAPRVIERLLHNARERIAELGGVTPMAGYGPPLEVLASYSASVDLLVVGSRSYGAIGRLVHGSTSDELARTARCALLVLPRSARGAAAYEDSNDRRSTVIDGAVGGDQGPRARIPRR